MSGSSPAHPIAVASAETRTERSGTSSGFVRIDVQSGTSGITTRSFGNIVVGVGTRPGLEFGPGSIVIALTASGVNPLRTAKPSSVLLVSTSSFTFFRMKTHGEKRTRCAESVSESHRLHARRTAAAAQPTHEGIGRRALRQGGLHLARQPRQHRVHLGREARIGAYGVCRHRAGDLAGRRGRGLSSRDRHDRHEEQQDGSGCGTGLDGVSHDAPLTRGSAGANPRIRTRLSSWWDPTGPHRPTTSPNR